MYNKLILQMHTFARNHKNEVLKLLKMAFMFNEYVCKCDSQFVSYFHIVGE